MCLFQGEVPEEGADFPLLCLGSFLLGAVQNGAARRPGVSNDGTHPLLHRAGVHRLDQKVHCTPLHAGPHVLFVGVGGDEDNGKIGGGLLDLELIEDRKAHPPAAQADIQQHRTDALPVLFKEGETLVGFREAHHTEEIFENLI